MNKILSGIALIAGVRKKVAARATIKTTTISCSGGMGHKTP
jgi:hypothetical protein